MPLEILMPALSPTMEEGTLSKWIVKEGDQVRAGDILAEIETDKAVMEFESVEDGVISSLLVEDGTESIKINTPIARLDSIETPSNISLKKFSKNNSETTPDKKPSIKAPKKDVKANTKLLKKYDFKTNTNPEFKNQSVREAIRDGMAEEMRLDENVLLLGEEVGEYQGAYKVSQGLIDEFGYERVVDTPITEHGFTGLAIGAAFAGLKPIVEFMTFNFAMQAIDQIVNSAAKTLYMSGGQMNCPIVFRGPNGAAARVAAQHSQDFSSWYASIPGLKVIQPFSAADSKGLLKAAIRDPNPVIFLENELLYGDIAQVPTDDLALTPIGKANIIKEGRDVTLVSFGIGVRHCLAAREILEKENISVEIVDLRTLRPLDGTTIIESVKKTNRCITVEEGFPVCSIGNHISALLMEHSFDYLDAPVLNCAGKDVPMPYAANLESLALVNALDVVNRVKEII